jgi:hypothetical protein
MEEEFEAIVNRRALIERGMREGQVVGKREPMTYIKGLMVLDIMRDSGLYLGFKAIFQTCHDRGSDRNAVLIMYMGMEFVCVECEYRVKRYWLKFFVRMTFEQGDAHGAFQLLSLDAILDRVQGIHRELTEMARRENGDTVRLVTAILRGAELLAEFLAREPDVEPSVRSNHLLWMTTRSEYEDDIMTMWELPEVIHFVHQMGMDIGKKRDVDWQAISRGEGI